MCLDINFSSLYNSTGHAPPRPHAAPSMYRTDIQRAVPTHPFFRAAPEPSVIADDKDPPRYEPSLRDLPPVGPPIRGMPPLPLPPLPLYHPPYALRGIHVSRAPCVFTDGFLRATSTSDAECCICDPTLTKSFANLPIICRFAVPAFMTFTRECRAAIRKCTIQPSCVGFYAQIHEVSIQIELPYVFDFEENGVAHLRYISKINLAESLK